MPTNPNRGNLIRVAAALLLSGGLMTAAIIDTHKTVPAIGTTGFAPSVPVVTAAAPPISQESVAEQRRARLLLLPKLHSLPINGTTCMLTAVKVTLAQFSATDDNFFWTNDLDWRSNGTVPPVLGCLTLNKNGYGQYHGSFDPDRNSSGTPLIDVMLRH